MDYAELTDEEINALVAEKIMGYMWVCGDDDGPYAMLYPPAEAASWSERFTNASIQPKPTPPGATILNLHLPSFATDIAHAHEAIDHWLQGGKGVRDAIVASWPDGTALVWLHESPETEVASSHGRPRCRAICEALLEAVEELRKASEGEENQP